jgi:hypothetical protein
MLPRLIYPPSLNYSDSRRNLQPEYGDIMLLIKRVQQKSMTVPMKPSDTGIHTLVSSSRQVQVRAFLSPRKECVIIL